MNVLSIKCCTDVRLALQTRLRAVHLLTAVIVVVIDVTTDVIALMS